jgi:rRNA maturation protein Nop10
MVRCDNCGWYNLDSSDKCEKCGEPLKRTEAPASFKKTVRFTPPHQENPDIQQVSDTALAECPKCKYPLSGDPAFCPNCGTTLRHSAPPPVPANSTAPETKKSDLKATVVIGSGTPGPVSAVADSLRKTGKETIRDLPKNLLQGQPREPERTLYRLVPLHGNDHPEVQFEEGDVVTIANLRFRFVK